MTKKYKIKGGSLLLLALAFLFEPYGMGESKDSHDDEGKKIARRTLNLESEKKPEKQWGRRWGVLD